MKKQECTTGIILIFIAIATVFYSFTSLKLGTINKPGPGFMPFWIAVALLILSIIWLVSVLKSGGASGKFWEKGQWVKPLIALSVTLAYAAVMEVLGYTLSTLAFVLAWQFAVAHTKWKKAVMISLITTVSMYVLFIYLLRVSVPQGIFSL